MRLAQVTASAALFAGFALARQDACSIELLNVNQAVVDTKCIPFDTTIAMKDPTGPGGGQLYKVHVNNLCGIGLDDGQELSNGASLRKMTSANDRNITEDMAFHWKFREKYLPVAPTPPHTDSGLQLHLAGASSSNKAYRPSYVMTQGGPYTIHRDVLRAHQGTSLSSKSFGILVTEMGYTEEEDYLREQRVIERKKRKIEKDAEKEKRRALWDQGQAESKQKAEWKRQRQAEYKQKVEEKRQQRQVAKKEKADERMAIKIQRMAVKEREMAKVNTKLDKGFFCLMASILVAILCGEALLCNTSKWLDSKSTAPFSKPSMTPKPQQKRRSLEETTEPLAGKIVFVPPKNRIIARLKPDLERTGYNHPGVIISSRPDGVGRVKIAMLTSFKDTPVAYVLDREEDYAHYLPIDDALHPISSIRRLKRRPESPSLRKKSYVYIGEKHTIPYEALEPYSRSSRYSAGPWLCEKSVRILQSHFGEPLDDEDEDDISYTGTSDAYSCCWALSRLNIGVRRLVFQPAYAYRAITLNLTALLFIFIVLRVSAVLRRIRHLSTASERGVAFASDAR
ncbi:hypothetical protein K4K54_006058 [Colletotrichum sp. SAR 10_86]|nr:hypothetical protein K4K54_006058 [Colletotrichum sp. SAR 10_86]